MRNAVAPFDWRSGLENKDIDSIGDDFALLESEVFKLSFDYPVKLNVSIGTICLSGTMTGAINLKQYSAKAPCLFITLSNQILQYAHLSSDFSGLYVVMSGRFTDDMFTNIQERYPLKHSIYDNPVIPLNQEELKSMMDYFGMMKKTVRAKDNPHRMEIVKHLTKAFFYGTGYQYHRLPENKSKSKNEILLGNFLDLVQKYYKEQRGLQFYAGKLCLTPKHLSKVIRDTSGNSASEWIDNHVILDARALLKSTDMSVQQISDELNFPSQSFFGKYFKRHTGESPKEYRKN